MTTTLLSIGIMIIATIISGISPIFLKKGTKKFDLLKTLRNPFRLLGNKLIMLGFSFDLLSAFLNVIALRFGDLSVLTPIGGMTYVWACVFSMRFLHERMTKRKYAGIGFILLGVILLTLKTL